MFVRRLFWCFLLSIPLLSSAQEKNAPCRADVEKFCSQSKSNGQQATDCLLDHQQEISDACYDAVKKRLDNQRDLKACKQDADEYCKGTQPGGGRIVRCLMDHQKEVSDDCYETLSKKVKSGGR